MKQIILAGVGGQGILLASNIIARAAIDAGFEARTAETIGMAQRGGSVVTHLRIADEGESLYSPMVEAHGADIILGFEPGEALRSIGLLAEGGCIVAANIGMSPTMSSPKEVVYDAREILEELREMGETGRISGFLEVNARDICEELGTTRALNTVMLGAAASSGVLGFSEEQIEEAMRESVKPKFVELNTRAIRLGAGMIES
ncbi:MAG: indolepyruvate oxidoreductase subunit beta [Coriobacteriales bacterium]